MKLAMAQMRMTGDLQKNLRSALNDMERAAAAGADLIIFPEVQLSPFFPAKEKQEVSQWLVSEEGPEVRAFCEACGRLGIWASPNVYLEENGSRYDASLLIDDTGRLRGVSKMVNIFQARCFYERDYYTPSDTGFRVYDTPFGKVGVVICFDRHIPDSIRSCAKQGAELVIIPTANLTEEPMELFEWEIRVQAFQNTVYVAMCNRVGQEGALCFAGESLVAGPDGSLLYKAGGEAGLHCVELPLEGLAELRRGRDWLQF
ncbi:MAG: carbon-nitrogen hydrolase family protein [Oscillospiraceae bacterium]|nr:carbon-nitrogen hydrolase family protein [Oscillospiraceae bacterium]